LAWSARRLFYLLEALAFAALVALYIWRMQAVSAWSWGVLFAWLMVSFLLHRDTPKTMGWRADNLKPATRRALWFFVSASALLGVIGLFLGMMHRLPIHLVDPHRFVGYLSFCLLQQVALNSYLTNRLLAVFESPSTAALLAGALFAALHWPNPILVPLTFVGGVAMARLFARDRNILPLALGQAIVGALVWWAFPVLWHHSMRVGPGYSTFHL
jgi:hypothetical protein